MNPADAFRPYRARYAVKAMKRPPSNTDELRQMTDVDGMRELSEAPAISFEKCSQLPNSAENAERGRHLWTIDIASIPFALEACAWGAKLQSGLIKHSNLSGGRDCHSGGEVWFVDDTTIVVNANSGRYGADTPEEFSEIVSAFVECGYRVASMGFDIDNPKIPNSVLIGEPQWQTKAAPK